MWRELRERREVTQEAVGRRGRKRRRMRQKSPREGGSRALIKTQLGNLHPRVSLTLRRTG